MKKTEGHKTDKNMKSGSDESHSDETYCHTEHGQWVPVVRDFIRDLKFGDVILTVHDGRVIQVQKTEKVRF